MAATSYIFQRELFGGIGCGKATCGHHRGPSRKAQARSVVWWRARQKGAGRRGIGSSSRVDRSVRRRNSAGKRTCLFGCSARPIARISAGARAQPAQKRATCVAARSSGLHILARRLQRFSYTSRNAELVYFAAARLMEHFADAVNFQVRFF
jgi:hypothetical protein